MHVDTTGAHVDPKGTVDEEKEVREDPLVTVDPLAEQLSAAFTEQDRLDLGAVSKLPFVQTEVVGAQVLPNATEGVGYVTTLDPLLTAWPFAEQLRADATAQVRLD